jgi:hypothetical protein
MEEPWRDASMSSTTCRPSAEFLRIQYEPASYFRAISMMLCSLRPSLLHGASSLGELSRIAHEEVEFYRSGKRIKNTRVRPHSLTRHHRERVATALRASSPRHCRFKV